MIYPKIVRGGNAIPIGDNLFLMKGRKHKNGGIDIGKDLEVEGGEVMQTSPNEIKVFSAQKFLGGESPAELILYGANPDRVFAAQEQYKNIHGINDDGSKKKAKGGSVVNWIKNILGINSDNTKSPVKGDDNDFYTHAEKLAKYQSSKFNISEEEALYNILNSKDYDYKGYFEEFGNLKPDSDGHFTDKYKTVYHDTFSDESIYSGKKSQYNPEGKVGGSWDENGTFIERKKQYGGMTNKENNASILGYVPSTGKRKKALMGSDGKEYTDVTQMPAGVTPKLHDLDWNDQNAYKAPIYTLNLNLNPTTNNNDEEDVLTGQRKLENDYWSTTGLGALGRVAAGVTGSIINNATNRKYLGQMEELVNKMKAYQIPLTKLKTSYNINPQLAEIENALRIGKNDIDANTASSQVALARKRAATLNATLEKNKLHGQKENIETDLINKDRLQQAQTIAENIRNTQNVENQKLQMLADIVDKRSENATATTQNIVGSVVGGVDSILNGANTYAQMLAGLAKSPDGAKTIYSILGEGQRKRKVKKKNNDKNAD